MIIYIVNYVLAIKLNCNLNSSTKYLLKTIYKKLSAHKVIERMFTCTHLSK